MMNKKATSFHLTKKMLNAEQQGVRSNVLSKVIIGKQDINGMQYRISRAKSPPILGALKITSRNIQNNNTKRALKSSKRTVKSKNQTVDKAFAFLSVQNFKLAARERILPLIHSKNMKASPKKPNITHLR